MSSCGFKVVNSNGSPDRRETRASLIRFWGRSFADGTRIARSFQLGHLLNWTGPARRMAELVAWSIQLSHLPSRIGSVRQTDELDCLFLVSGFIFLWNLCSGIFVESVSRKPPWGKVILDADFEITVFYPNNVFIDREAYDEVNRNRSSIHLGQGNRGSISETEESFDHNTDIGITWTR